MDNFITVITFVKHCYILDVGVNIYQKAVTFGYRIVLKFDEVLLMLKKIIQWKRFEISKKVGIVSEILRNIYPCVDDLWMIKNNFNLPRTILNLKNLK